MPHNSLNPLRAIIRSNIYMSESESIEHLLKINPVNQASRQRIESSALNFVEQCRQNPDKQGLFDAFLQEYSLSSQEGVVLMCLAEALLRVPDSHTIDQLIAEKIHLGEWGQHIGKSEDLLVNAASAGLVLTDKILGKKNSSEEHPDSWFRKLISRVGEPVVRHATLQAMKFMGQQYVLGRDISEAAKRGKKGNPDGTRFSFDMLGEGARTYVDAEKYFAAYMQAIHSIGKLNQQSSVYAADGISVKLSALHPRYEFSQHSKVIDELIPSVTKLAIEAKKYNIGFTIDAEEAARLDIELDVFQSLAFDPQLSGWDGLGFVLQAYQKRALYVVDWLVELAQLSKHKLMVRLVKGAYWDAEIKHAQELGLSDFPVFSRKVNTDLSYQVCAGKLLENRQNIYPQFATHNAYTVALIMELAANDKNIDELCPDQLNNYEFQRLHGMGDLLYDQIGEILGAELPLRVYAPVGVHRDLLPYLVRRLLENGANGSFVNQFLDGKVPASTLVKSVESVIESLPGSRNTQIPLANEIFNSVGEKRNNSRGVDLDDPIAVERLIQHVNDIEATKLTAGPIINGEMRTDQAVAIYSPANTDVIVGYCTDANQEEVIIAMASAHEAQANWQALGVEARANMLDKTADLLEEQTETLTALISFEAGRTLGDGVSEVREAVDFCRYYAVQIRELASKYPQQKSLLQGKGVFVCISPWNFPLAIFIGQVVAALVAGNSVVAKPAEQTPLVAALAVKILHQAGVPVAVLQLLTGLGREIGPLILADHRVAGVAFTGSTETAQRIQGDLIKRGGKMPPFIAETGGQNVMIVDSTALPEQVVDDVIQSAFLSAGQRCSALRVLYVQEDIADNVLSMLKGAIATLSLGRPWLLSSDIGPVIDSKALQTLQQHCEKMHAEGQFLAQGTIPETAPNGHYFAPQVFEIDNISRLTREVFGPILHVIRYKASQLDQVINDVNNTGYGLTLGIHSRIKQFADKVFAQTRVGNTYINRNMVGAVVGVNPFGGQGLSGTGFKAGGPHYLLRFTQLWQDAKISKDCFQEIPLSDETNKTLAAAKVAQRTWGKTTATARVNLLKNAVDQSLKSGAITADAAAHSQVLLREASTRLSHILELPGPTGETNELSLHPRGVFMLLVEDSDSEQALGYALAALVSGNGLLLCARESQTQSGVKAIYSCFASLLPKGLVQQVENATQIGGLLLSDAIAGVAASDVDGIVATLGQRKGAIIPLVEKHSDIFTLMPYLCEKTKTNNIVATGGNAMLLNLKE